MSKKKSQSSKNPTTTTPYPLVSLPGTTSTAPADAAPSKKRKNSKGKGNAFERKTCAQLSLWWTAGERDDVFCRSNSSGGRATQRSKKDKDTANQHGDVALSDARGEPFLKYFVVELKKGYNTSTPHDLIDGKGGELKQWITKASGTAEKAGTRSWLLIHRRDGRKAYCVLPTEAFDALIDGEKIPYTVFYHPEQCVPVVCVGLDDFLKAAEPHLIHRDLSKPRLVV